MLGALLMSAGHIAMSFDQSFLIALSLLIIGSGCLKGNISAQVGQLYPADDESQRDARLHHFFDRRSTSGRCSGRSPAEESRPSMDGMPASGSQPD